MCSSPLVSRWIVLGIALVACGSDDSSSTAPSDDGPEPAVEAEEEPRLPGYPLIDDGLLMRVPERFDHLIPRLTNPMGPRFENLRYEANNVGMRGRRGEDGFYELTGQAIAERWRVGAAGVRGVFAVRDSLFSQQDHPIDHDPVSVMMPLVWVTVAVSETIAGRELRPVQAPALDDDEAWRALSTPDALFGSFPPSERLHEVATRNRTVLAPERLRVTNARRSVQMLARDARAMVAAQAEGANAVARVGAARIVASDARYFGERLRREHVILVAAENPNRQEMRDEMKGLALHGRELGNEAVQIARWAILSARLAEGDIGLERYHLGRPEERRRAIAVLSELIPLQGDPGGTVWLYVHGGMDASGVRGTDAAEFIHPFRQEMSTAGIDTTRLQLMNKPHTPIGGSEMALKLDVATRRSRIRELPLNLAIGTGLVDRLIREIESR